MMEFKKENDEKTPCAMESNNSTFSVCCINIQTPPGSLGYLPHREAKKPSLINSCTKLLS